MTIVVQDLTLPQDSKFKISSHPAALPNKCAGCGIGHNDDNRRYFIDMGISLEFYGVFYLCTDCFVEVATLLGFISADIWQHVKNASKNLEIRREALEIENDTLRTTVELLASHRCYPTTSDASDLADEAKREVVRPDDEVVSNGSVQSSDDVKPDSVEGLSDVRGNAKPDKPAAKSKPKPDGDPFAELGL